MKISDKLKTVTNEVSISRCDNGFIFEVRGETPDENWASAKIVCSGLEDAIALLTEFASLKTND
jgi:hypothetical protein